MYTLEELFSRPKKVTVQELRTLSSQGKLFHQGKKVVVDPLTSVDFFYEIEGAHVHGKIKVSGKEFSLEACEGVFSDGVVQCSILRFFSDPIAWSWVEAVYPHPQKLTREFLSKCEKQVDAPSLRWKDRKPEPVPELHLKDRTGGFADLWMNYGILGQMAVSGRALTAEEQFWEKDLLETGFIKKQVGSSHYYCPLDKVGKSLSFLLELGWTIYDYQGRKVVRQGVTSLQAIPQEEKILLKGKISYGEHEANLSQIYGAFNRREQFLDLGAYEVGLLDMPEGWGDLATEEIIGEAVAIRRQNFGLLEDLVPLPQEYKLAEWKEVLPSSHFQGKLYPYQQQGLNWLSFLYRSHFHGLLADEMGLGKTVQLLAFFSTLTKNKPILVVMPRSLLFNWKREFERFLPHLSVYIHSGSDREKENLQTKDVILTSYAILRQDRLLFESLDFECVILDEAQVIKNPESLVAQIACRLKAQFRLAVTGTPVENRFEDLWSLFRFLMPELLGEKREFPVLERVRKKIRPFTLRRMKEEVDFYLPPKQEQIVWVDLEESQRAYYEQYLSKSRSGLLSKVQAEGMSKHRFEVLETILRLRQICCHPHLVSGEAPEDSGKLERLLSDLEEVRSSGHKVLVYSQFTTLLRMIEKKVQERSWKYTYLDGQTQNREKAVEQFQTDPETRIFFISLKAGGVGLNLTAADYVFLFDPWWNDAVENQAIDRAHRVGRTKPVIARRYIAAETIEEKILRLKEHKRALSRDLLDFDEELKGLTEEDLWGLLGD
jgi:SNF2 family DNA or RNA helicase